jgi:hypothetical protein
VEDLISKVQDALQAVNPAGKPAVDVRKSANRHAFELIMGMRRDVKKILSNQERSKWIEYITGILIGLISSGLYDAIKVALESLVARAPYAEAQIYEIETDIYSELPKWRAAAAASLPVDSATDMERLDHALVYSLHALCILSVLGPNVRHTKLFKSRSS